MFQETSKPGQKVPVQIYLLFMIESKLLLRVLTSWTVWRKTGDFSRSVIDGSWSMGTSQLSHVFSDATDQERRELLVVGTEGCGAQMCLPSYLKPADLNKVEALTAG